MTIFADHLFFSPYSLCRRANLVRDTVVIDGKMVTSRGPGTALPFAFAWVDVLGGDSDFIKGRFLYNEMKL